jgi:dCTP deaminase
MPLADVQIEQALNAGEIDIQIFDPSMLQPASYDLKVGKHAATVPQNGDREARIDLEKEGVLVIQPYAPAVIFTHEVLRLSLSYIGHFGLKSKLARRGITASVGVQVDPGFHGPLSVTLMNPTPTPVLLNYREDFLTLEIEKLSVPASRPYSGDYQGRDNFSSRELAPVIGYKGHALTDVVKGFDDIRDAVRGVAEMSHRLDTFMKQHSDEIRHSQQFNQALLTEMKKLVEHIVGERTSTVILRSLSRDQAKQEIVDLFRSTTGPLFYSDIAERLQMDLEQVLEITHELEREGVIGELGSHGSIKE